MTPETKKKVVIWSSIITLIGVGGYFAYKFFVKGKKTTDTDKSSDSSSQPSNEPSTTTVVKSPNIVQQNVPQSDNRPSDILAFQKFANSKGAKLVEDGSWGPNTAKAWATYGSAYNSQKSSSEAKSNGLFKSGDIVITKAPQNTFAYRVVNGLYKSTNEPISISAYGTYRIDSNPVPYKGSYAYYVTPLDSNLQATNPGKYFYVSESILKLK